MQNPRLASRYAKSLLDLAVEKNILDETLKDMRLLNSIFQQSRDFELMLRSPVIKGDKKLGVINAVLAGRNINVLTNGFINLLVSKGREANLPEIATSFISQYNTLKHIRTVSLTTAAPVSDSVKSGIQSKLAGFLPKDTIELKTAVDETLIGGFVLELEDKLYDASVKKALSDLRTRVMDSSYQSKM